MSEIPEVVLVHKWCCERCKLTDIAGTTPPLLTSPLPPSVEFLQSLAGLVRLSPTPCRCYRLEHSRSAKWGDWSLLDLWLLDPPQLNRVPHLLLPFPSALLLPPCYYHFLLSLLLGVRKPITRWFVVWFASGGPPKPLQPSCGISPILPFFLPFPERKQFLICIRLLIAKYFDNRLIILVIVQANWPNICWFHYFFRFIPKIFINHENIWRMNW